ncbi:amino acid ABC transporter substrate-binding protein [Roseomonas sp. CAU 1739]|uniref:amino acid ABC transporter substrate-binding protein n=1 Tax=Roseomonas sp. CAU 1739 TaxID=3140364 RepID=UPI00325A67DF
MRDILRAIALSFAVAFATEAAAQNVQPGPTLQGVRQRDALLCGAAPNAPGFGAPDSRGDWQGIDPDICRALAAAVLGDATKIRFFPLTSQARFAALQSGQIDVLPRTVTWTHSRDTAVGLNFTTPVFYDGQGFLVRRSANIRQATDLAGATICTFAGSTSELNLADWARANRVQYTPLVFEQNDEARIAYDNGRCDAISTDASQLIGLITAMRVPSDHTVLRERISKEPLTPAVRQGDDQWNDIVRWTIFALIEAEELGVTQANAEQMLASDNPSVRRLLGNAGDHGPMMALDRRWAYNAIRAVGNYGEIFERHVGHGSPIGLDRGINDLWTRGGLMYAPPIR